MRELFKILARLKSEQYDGIRIIKALWEKKITDRADVNVISRSNSGEKSFSQANAGAGPNVIKDNRRFLVCEAVFRGERLCVTMLKIPDGIKILGVIPENDNTEGWLSQTELTGFLAEVGDNNSIHRGDNPVVPGMLLLERIKKELPSDVNRMELSFRNAVYLWDKPVFSIEGNHFALQGREVFVTGNFSCDD
ncbi:MAG: hypothetical protein K6C05_07445 [Anaerovibrio sp.]|uniref:hypothetical protein n=1 Tax=Anaerovibrio sp. TaxID=1872532 RepID=UPI0025DFC872|nr:hypothetical protein [Anaerovibrio sp.]MCR5176673.1 hypothetical protein [Anaerovibrio sp.]